MKTNQCRIHLRTPKLELICNFFPKTAWKWKNLDPRGSCIPGAPLLGPVCTWKQLCVFYCHHVRTVTLMTMQPNSDDMLTNPKICVIVAKWQRALRSATANDKMESLCRGVVILIGKIHNITCDGLRTASCCQ